ncbi:hypothetical protein [Pedobacter endophyticus]|uniref:Uncharacterized protein n=1 Tax=Pedobacter endophyticus TaxID=2789740 RepID=A0A7S9L195_9SPHI|nr:hypothetical protein [Pedobacter endophyticus]QPH40573.1 hypothetical protein IZT61_04650 [Pedobacter endophyticus]
MNEEQVTPQHLWDLYNIPVNNTHEFLFELGFVFHQKIENLSLYIAHGRSFVLTEKDGFTTKVQFNLTDEAIFNECIDYAMDALAFETIYEEFGTAVDVLRLDNTTCSLVCMAVHSENSRLSFNITLLAKLAVPTTESKIEIRLTPLPLLNEN